MAGCSIMRSSNRPHATSSMTFENSSRSADALGGVASQVFLLPLRLRGAPRRHIGECLAEKIVSQGKERGSRAQRRVVNGVAVLVDEFIEHEQSALFVIAGDPRHASDARRCLRAARC